ncbi:MAG: hypothetical protein GY832_26195 [Chloroflexi bacterium]|nr:hypothetical protein [Chloroflexota bacterium]
MNEQTINYHKHKVELNKVIRNLSALPGGTGCKFLLTIKGQGDTLIAKQWKRKRPVLASNEVLICF